MGRRGGGGEGGDGAASVKIEFAPQFNVERAAIAVFTARGFQFTDRGVNRLVFQQGGGPAGQERFGSWFGEGVEVMVEISITSPEYRTSVLQCVVRKSEHGLAGPWVVTTEGRGAFKRLLQEVKDLARAL